MQTLRLLPNVPIDLTLAFPEGRSIDAGMIFSTIDGRALFVTHTLGFEINQKLRDVGARRGDRVRILDAVSYVRGVRTHRLSVFNAPPARVRPDGTFPLPCVGSSL